MKNSTPQYKYRLHYLLRRLTVNDYEIAMELLPRLCGVVKATFRNWIYTPGDSSNEIPGTAIIKLAIFFQVQPRELYEIPPVLEEIEKLRQQLTENQ